MTDHERDIFSENGFWNKDIGCLLPFESRSIICNTALCDLAKAKIVDEHGAEYLIQLMKARRLLFSNEKVYKHNIK